MAMTLARGKAEINMTPMIDLHPDGMIGLSAGKSW
jgi:hypothetical protein